MLRHLTACVFGVAALMAASAPASAEKRVALVIGNSAYQHTGTLKNPSNDATDMARTLRELDFEVIDGTDLTKRDMVKRIRTFADKVRGADVGLFYYAGHGLQVNGRNFLAPVDAKLSSDVDLDFEAVELDLVLKQLERSSRLSLVFLDACRDNPLAMQLAQTSRSLGIGRGLAQVEKAVGMMIAFSTQPGNVALDGDGRNSPYTAALLRHIAAQGRSINDTMIEVRRDVLEQTDGKQVPWENSSLTGQFFFKPAPLPPTAGGPNETAAQIAALREEIERLKGAKVADGVSQAARDDRRRGRREAPPVSRPSSPPSTRVSRQKPRPPLPLPPCQCSPRKPSSPPTSPPSLKTSTAMTARRRATGTDKRKMRCSASTHSPSSTCRTTRRKTRPSPR
ncbi:caspase family protein [Methyloceanibacter superfactus]|nr:caspase domain-containing protein [Methyloceanibacter superfactus]